MESQHLQRLWPLCVKGISLRPSLVQTPAGSLPQLVCFIKDETFLRLISINVRSFIKYRIFFLIKVQIVLNCFQNFCLHTYIGQLTIHSANQLMYTPVNEITATNIGIIIELSFCMIIHLKKPLKIKHKF